LENRRRGRDGKPRPERNPKIKTVFGNGLNLRKWIGIIINLIDIRKKVRIFCIKNEIFYLNSNKK
jgi:hypothetical protein